MKKRTIKRIRHVAENLATIAFILTFMILFTAPLMPWDLIATPLYTSAAIFTFFCLVIGATTN